MSRLTSMRIAKVFIGVTLLASLALLLYESTKEESSDPSLQATPQSANRSQPTPELKEPRNGIRSKGDSGSVLVLDRVTGVGIPEAEIIAVGETQVALRTDESGRAMLPPDFHASVSILHSDFEPWTGPLGVGDTVSLDKKVRLHGRLVPPEDAPRDLSDVVVVAWSESIPDPESTLGAVSKGQQDGVFAARCSTEGVFSFSDFPKGNRILVAAGGQGLASPAQWGIEANPGEELALNVYWLHGVELQYERGTHLPARLSIRASPPNSLSIRSGSVAVRAHGIRNPQMYLNGMVLDAPTDFETSHQFMFGLTNKRLVESEWPRLAGQYLGYEPLSVPIEFRPVVDGLTQQTVSLIPLSDATADLTLTIGPRLAEVLCSSTDQGQFSTLYLNSREHRSSGNFLIPAGSPPQIVIPEIPTGEYSGKLILPGGQSLTLNDVADTKFLEVKEGGTTIPMECEALSWLELQLLRSDGGEYTGPATVDYGRMMGNFQRKSNMIAFATKPYRIPILKPGKYAGAVTIPELVELTKDGELQFEVGMGDRVSATATLRTE